MTLQIEMEIEMNRSIKNPTVRIHKWPTIEVDKPHEFSAAIFHSILLLFARTKNAFIHDRFASVREFPLNFDFHSTLLVTMMCTWVRITIQ